MRITSFLRALLTLGRSVALGLSEADAGTDPIALFGRWFGDAGASGMLLPEAMTLATATPDGAPSARMVLLKAFGPDGFVFYTNYDSRKARELDHNPRAALVFHWPVHQRQVRVEGRVERTSQQSSAGYFRTRSRGSRIAAWASTQSAPIQDRQALDQRFHEQHERFRGQDVPLPPFWGGYRLVPDHIEFWQGRINRLHDRFAFQRAPDGGAWERLRLQP
ncbi:MAG TPA: pyridoxamine 5'-phosphate oxidase [Longimicrobiales bacterium]|nr:pyridoxamine 5'-phosphate oxidase [Longimicrobiales bacterium]